MFLFLVFVLFCFVFSKTHSVLSAPKLGLWRLSFTLSLNTIIGKGKKQSPQSKFRAEYTKEFWINAVQFLHEPGTMLRIGGSLTIGDMIVFVLPTIFEPIDSLKKGD